MEIKLYKAYVKSFKKLSKRHKTIEEDYLQFSAYIKQNPEAGVIEPDTNGARKIRMKIKGKGKSGALRIVYYLITDNNEIHLLDIYDKHQISMIEKSIIKRYSSS